jgi:hypothetical protein
MDPLTSLAKGTTGAILDKIQEMLERNETCEDSIKDPTLKDRLVASIERMQRAEDGVRPGGGTNEVGGAGKSKSVG